MNGLIENTIVILREKIATGSKSRSDRSSNVQSLSPQEKEYVDEAEQQLKTDQKIEEMIYLWVGKEHVK